MLPTEQLYVHAYEIYFSKHDKRDDTEIRQRWPPVRQKPVQADGLSNTLEGQGILNHQVCQ